MSLLNFRGLPRASHAGHEPSTQLALATFALIALLSSGCATTRAGQALALEPVSPPASPLQLAEEGASSLESVPPPLLAAVMQQPMQSQAAGVQQPPSLLAAGAPQPFPFLSEVVQTQPAALAAPVQTSAQELRARPPLPPSDPELAAAFLRYALRAQKERGERKRGSGLPGSQKENWEALLESFDGYLGRPAKLTEEADLLRARAALEFELSRDARFYGDFPAELAEAVMARLTTLGVRLAEVNRLGEENDGLFAWPVDPVHITSLFGNRRHPITRRVKPHRGLDLAARKGQEVFAAAGGTVVKAGKNSSHGLQVTIQHPSGLQTRYSHLSQVLVEVGTRLEAGEVLGLAGRTGRATGVHLHFEVWDQDVALDPLDHLRELPEGSSGVSTRS